MQKWRFLDTGYLGGAMNMAIDEVLMHSCRTGKSLPIIRFYGWEPACLSLGFFQKSHKEIDVSKCKDMGIDLVRRATGGRAVLHDNEITYSVIVSEDNTMMPRTVTESYKVISQGLLEGFKILHIPATLSAEVTIRAKDFRSSACFEAPSSYEVVAQGKKIVGSAQVRKDGIILQHGAIINELDADKLFALFKIENPEALARMKSLLLDKATSIKEVYGETIPYEKLSSAFYDGFQKGLEIELIPEGLTAEELSMAEKLYADKYNNDEWTYMK